MEDRSTGSPTPPRRSLRWGNVLTVAIILIALVVGVVALVQLSAGRRSTAGSSNRFDLDLSAHMEIPASLLRYTELRRVDVTIDDPHVLAVSRQGTVYVGGDGALEIHAADTAVRQVPVEGTVTGLAVAPAGGSAADRICVASGRHLVVLDQHGELLEQWPDLAESALVTSIALHGDTAYVADAGQRVVWRLDAGGRVQSAIGQQDPERQTPAFVIPSAYFDLAVDADDLLHVVNPGMRRVETYNEQGELQSFWGRAGAALSDFFGCCNPAHLAMLPDGRFVTSEKGIPRVKVYAADGDLQCVVAGPRQLGVPASALGDARGNAGERVFDVAVDGAGNIYVLDPHQRQVIVFAEQEKSRGSAS